MPPTGPGSPLNCPQQLWQAALGALEVQMSPGSFQTFLKDSRGVAFDGQVLEVTLPNIFAREWVQERLHSLVANTVASLAGREVAVRFLFAEAVLPPPTHPHPSFPSLVRGDFNRLAYTAAHEVLAQPGRRYNPLVLWGGTGVGKTHLLQAIARQAAERGLRALYVTGEQFTNQFIAALRYHAPEAFRQGFHSLDLCLMDDIQFLQGKGQTLQAFFHIFNELCEACCQLVLASDQPPRELSGLDERLRSRLGGGLLVKMESPGEKDRLILLTTIAQQSQLPLPAEIASYMAHHLPGNIMELRGAVNRLQALARAQASSLTLELASQALGQALPPPRSPTAIAQSILARFHLPTDAFQTRRRQRPISQARLIAIYLLRQEGFSLSQIGEAVGGLAKSSVLANYRQTQRKITQDPQLNSLLTEFREAKPSS